MANYFRDFMQPAKIIFERLAQQNNKRIFVNGADGNKGTNVTPPIFVDLPEYPCKLIRGVDGKVTEVQYGEDSRGYIWRQLLIRGANGKLDKVVQENPDGTFDIVFHRDDKNKVELINLD